MSIVLRSSVVWLAAAALCASACKGDKPPPAAPGDAAPSSVATSSSAAAAAPVPSAAAANAPLLETLQTVAKTCRPVPGEGRINCGQGAQWKLSGSFVSGRQPRDNAAVTTLTLALTDPDPGMSGLSAALLHSAFGPAWGRETAPAKLEPSAADALLEAVLAKEPALAKQTMPAAVNVAMLAGRAEHLYAELGKPQNATLREAAYPHLMTFGRSAQLPKVKQLVKASDLPLALAALEAPLNMPSWTEPEAKQICDWAQSLLSDARPPVSKQAARVLAACSGAWIDALLARSEKVLASDTVDVKDLAPLGSLCKPDDIGRSERVSEKQCQQARKLLSSVAESSRVDADIRKEAKKLADAAAPKSASPG